MSILHHGDSWWESTIMYAVTDDSWSIELSKIAGPQGPDGPGPPTAMVAIVPDEDPAREPTILLSDTTLPYDVVRWFMEQVTEEVARVRAEFAG